MSSSVSGHPEDSAIRQLRDFYGLIEIDGRETELDLGCGSGSYAVRLAQRYPERRILAADVMLGRLRKTVRRAAQNGCGNVECLRVEARYLVGRLLPDHALRRIHLLCPDPWPKDRHRGHRLLASDFTTQLHRVLRLGGIFHFSSDDVRYCEAVGRVLEASGLFAPASDGIADLTGLQSDFEARWLSAGRSVPHRAWKALELPKITIGH